ncbi:hypothetical protein BU23DRAFT_540717 [Bimuria novae-zelandiae CBS 107.79]|uniref:BRCT domain-containing protein n=1 Tax=Bimuria novae-zelandiae CBS 107.79 TaxID=1447943 RepID=A0A6A5UXN7_9PLEO|nr:hypothetical protein BU23DRAFT_540717 [Bimuria novae-zelandiae CBS 107.79]
MAESQESARLQDNFYDDPSQLSQLLRQRAGVHSVFHFSNSTASHSINPTHTLTTEGLPSPQPAAPAPSLSPTRAASRRVRFDSRHATPSLSKHNSAPASTGELLTEKENTRRMYQTFNGTMDAPGDTQLDPEIFKELTSGLFGSNSMIGVPQEPPVPAAEDGSSESARDFVVVSSQEQRSGGITSPVTINNDPETQYRAQYAETSPLKLLQTPAAYNGRKRDSQGQELSSVAKETPGTDLSASAFFGFGDTAASYGMSLTQAFNATQAKTSPAVGHAIEDVVFQRPSPNFARPRHSSPDATMSSPIKTYTNRRQPVDEAVLRSSSEPRVEYESMKHSQERRSRERESEEIGVIERQDSWEEPTGLEKQFARQKAKDRFEREAARSLAAVSAPTPSARRTRKGGLSPKRATTMSPVKVKRTERTSYHGPYDGAGADHRDEVSQPPRNPDYDDESPDELASHEDLFNRSPALTTTVRDPGLRQRIQVPYTSSHPPPALSGHTSRSHSQPEVSSSQVPPESQVRASASQPVPRRLSRLRSSKETEVVMNSQPEPSQSAPLRFPSSPSTNQYSINQTTMLPRFDAISSPMSSMVPMPPKSSSPEFGMPVDREDFDEEAEERVPSSPPLIAPEDDIIYDEHSDDELGDFEGRGHEEDVIMGDGEDRDGFPPAQDDDVVQPQSGDEGEDEGKSDEVPETMEHEHNDLIRSTHPGDKHYESTITSKSPTQADRQPTLPEDDTLEETQLSFSPNAGNAVQPDISTEVNAVVKSETVAHDGRDQHFEAAKEPQSTSQDVNVTDNTRNESVSTPVPAPTKRTSLLDIANLPDTQRSVNLDELDIPQLSVDEDSDDPLNAIMAQNAPSHPRKKRRTTYSTKKAIRDQVKDTDPLSDALSSSPQPDVSYTPGWSPPTTQDRGARGAQAAARALNEARVTQSATLKSKSPFKLAQPQTPRSGALKPVNKALLSKSPGKTSSKGSRQDRDEEPTTPSRSTGIDHADIEMHDAGRLDTENEPVQDAEINDVEQDITPATDEFVDNPSGERPLPNRVFAYWPGKGYYPATCIGRVDTHRLRVRYDDGQVNTLEATQVRALDLRARDQVKIDITGMKKFTYIVIGFKDKVNLEDPALEYPVTNRHGYATIVLEQKVRDSLPAGASTQPKEHVDVPVDNIYLTTQLWGRIKDRTFQYKPGATPDSRVATPKTVESAIPVATTLRKSTTRPSLLRDSTVRASSIASSTRSSGNVFSNMAFAITSTSEAINRDGLSKLITSNGGLLVDDGFHELFDTDSYDAPASSASSAKAPPSSMHGLQLKRENEDLHFVALISESFSRKPKFIQALALNIPCLHLRWVHDSIAAGHALPFPKYLLPAGVSTFLDPAGVVRSRDMPIYDPTADDVTFAQMVKDRKLFFRGQSILIVTEQQEQEPYIFLTHAMGAAEVGQCTDLDEAKDSVESGAWDWVYMDLKKQDLSSAAVTFLGKGKSKKRKRNSDVVKSEALVRHGTVGNKTVRVACSEFVIQSVILGALIEE